MARILAIDGEPSASRAFAHELGDRGHRVIVATSGSEGVRLARAKRPAVVLLQQRLTDRSGLEVCKILKGDPATERIPVVMIADHADAIERAVARELGALEHLVRPFTFGELLARVETACATPVDDPSHEAQVFGCLAIGACGRRVWVEGETVEMTPVELAVLLVLCEGTERVHTREELRERIWGEEGHDDTRAVDQYVKRLRRKLGKAGQYIETVYGVGYRFAKTRAEGEGGS